MDSSEVWSLLFSRGSQQDWAFDVQSDNSLSIYFIDFVCSQCNSYPRAFFNLLSDEMLMFQSLIQSLLRGGHKTGQFIDWYVLNSKEIQISYFLKLLLLKTKLALRLAGLKTSGLCNVCSIILRGSEMQWGILDRRENWNVFGVFLKPNKPLLRQPPAAVRAEGSVSRYQGRTPSCREEILPQLLSRETLKGAK